MMKQLKNIRNDIMRDLDVFEKCAEMSFNAYSDGLEIVSIISYKVLMGYSLSVIKEHDKEIFDLILEKSFLFSAWKLDGNFSYAIVELEHELYFNNMEFFDVLSLFGWNVKRYDNLEVIEKRVDYFKDFPEDAASFVQSEADMVIEDRNTYDSYLDLIVMQNENFGNYCAYVNRYPERKNPLLHDLISKTVNFLSVPIYAWYSDFCGNMISWENVYYSVFTMGYYGDRDQYAGMNFNMPGCFLIAYYLWQLLEIARDMLPGYRECVGNLK